MAKEIKFMFDRRFDLPNGSLSSSVSEVMSSVIDEMIKPENNLNPEQKNTQKTLEKEEKPFEPTFSLSETEALKQESFDLGFAKGLEKAKHEKEELILKTLENILDALVQIQNRQTDFEQKQEINYINLALTTCEKIIPEFIKKYGNEEIKAFLKQYLPNVTDEDKIIIKVSPENQKNINQYIEENNLFKGKEKGYSLETDETLQNSDCIISWKNGSIERKTAETFHTIKDVLNNYTNDTSSLKNDQENNIVIENNNEEDSKNNGEKNGG